MTFIQLPMSLVATRWSSLPSWSFVTLKTIWPRGQLLARIIFDVSAMTLWYLGSTARSRWGAVRAAPRCHLDAMRSCAPAEAAMRRGWRAVARDELLSALHHSAREEGPRASTASPSGRPQALFSLLRRAASGQSSGPAASIDGMQNWA